MYQYPSIMGPNQAPHLPCIAFEKIDGSNLRWEWNRKRGWNKFGTRQRLFDATEEVFAPAINLFITNFADGIQKAVADRKEYRNAERVTAFTEFFGPNSFAGQHDPKDDKQLVLFDIHVLKKGLLGPREFLDVFGHLRVAKVVYEGILNASFIRDVKDGKYPVTEGVVCKGGSGHKLWMRKIKTETYLQRLKQRFPDNWKELWE